MPSWLQIASDDLRSAEALYSAGSATPGLYRAAVNRYYYAAFHLLTDELVRLGAQASFYRGRQTPGHKELPSLVELWLTHLSERRRGELSSAISRLYRRRENADYSTIEIEEEYCKESRRFLEQIQNLS